MKNDLLSCSDGCMCEREGKKKEDCKMWIDYPEDNNCTLNSIQKHGPMTLAEVSKRLGVSIVRISQIEKAALKKLSKRIKI